MSTAVTPRPLQGRAWSRGLVAVASLAWLGGLATLLLFNSWRWLTPLATVFAILALVGSRRLRRGAVWVLVGVLVSVAVTIQLHYWYPLLAFLGIVTGAVGLALLGSVCVRGWRGRRRRGVLAGLGRGLAAVGVLVLTLALAAAGACALVAPTSLLAGATGATNSYQPDAAPADKTLSDGTRYVSNVRYATQYPNSFLDVYTARSSSTPRPTYVYIHGGGYIAGDKIRGDVYATSSDPFAYYTSFVHAGFTVVSINYAFAAAHPYPTQLVQTGQAVRFIVDHAREYGIDPTRLFIGGGSAGGQVAGQFALVQTDHAYATRVGIAPTIPGSSLRGVVLGSSLLEPQRFDESGSPVIDWLWNNGGRAEWGLDYETSRAAALASIPDNFSAAYPPVFLSDGNVATFHRQAIRFDQLLTASGHDHVTVLQEDNPHHIPHGYETDLTRPEARATLQKTLDFMRQHSR